jgi:hypothetical protein
VAKRIHPNEFVEESIKRIPFLKRFLHENRFMICPFDREKINEYMGFEHIKPYDNFTSKAINKVLKEAERRGEI